MSQPASDNADNSYGLEPGTLIGGRFRIDKRLAAGGMGVVYRATQEPLGRPVALKVLRKPQDPRLDDSYSQRFLREAAVVANLSHPNTVVVHDYGQDGTQLYFAMEYVDGVTLAAYVRKNGALSPSEVVHVAKQIASSLTDAHGQDLVHRDLKPGNVMLLTRGGDPLFTKVLDFGLVKMVAEDSNLELTQSGVLMGSPRYMAPEQVKGTEIDARTDVYSFGALLCFMLTGKSPFPAGSQFEAMRAHVYTPAPRLHELLPGCNASPELETLVLRCLEKEPDARYASMDEVLAALSTLAAERRASAPMPAPPPPMPDANESGSVSAFVTGAMLEPGKSKAAWALRIAIMVGVVTVGGVLAFLFAGGEEPTATPLPPVEPVLPGTPDNVANGANTTGAPTQPGGETNGSEDTQNTAETETLEEAQRVLVQVEPASAVIRHDGEVLGTGEVPVRVRTDQPWTLSISAEGYESVEQVIDGSLPEVLVTLTAVEVVEEASAEETRPRRGERGDSSMMGMAPRPERVETPMAEAEMTQTMDHSPSVNMSVIRDPWAN